MKTYRLQRTEEANTEWFGTMADVKAATKTIVNGLREQATIDEVEVPTDKASIIDMLNGVVREQWPVTRMWSLSPRGAFVENKE